MMAPPSTGSKPAVCAESAGSALLIAVVGAIVFASVFVVVEGLIDQGDELTERLHEAQSEISGLLEQSDVQDLVARQRPRASSSRLSSHS